MPQVIDLTGYQSPFPALAQRNQENLQRAFENEVARRERLKQFEYAKALQEDAKRIEQERYDFGQKLAAEERTYQREQDAQRNKINDVKLGADLAANYGLSEDDLPALSGIFGDAGTNAAKSVIRGNNRIAISNSISAGAPSMSDEELSKLIDLLPEQNRMNAVAAANSSRAKHNMYSQMLNALTLEKSGIDKMVQEGSIGVEEGFRMISQLERRQQDVIAGAMKDGIDLNSIPGTGIYQQVDPFNYGSAPAPGGFSVQSPAAMIPGYVPPGAPANPNNERKVDQAGKPGSMDVFPAPESRLINQGVSTTSFLPEELPGGMFSGRNRVSVENHRQDLEGFLQNLANIDVSGQPEETQKKVAEEIGFIGEGLSDINKGEYNSPAVQYLLDVSGISQKPAIRKIPAREYDFLK